MSQESRRSVVTRRKRVERLKKMIVFLILLLVMAPGLCCIVLFGKLRQLETMFTQLDEKMDQIQTVLESAQEEKTEVAVITNTSGETVSRPQTVSGGDAERTGVMERKLHRVYLTFDDGPSTYTDEILDILKRYDIKATFFVVGKEDEHSKEMLGRIVDEGHTLGMHSYSHKYSELYESPESFAEDFEKIQTYLYEVTGVKSLYYRFPGGTSNTVSRTPMDTLMEYLDGQGVTYYDWNAASGDAGSRLLTVQELVKNSIKGVEQRETTILLMHDSADKRTTVEALPVIIEELMAMEDVVILPITEETEPIQHKSLETKEEMEE